MPITQELFKTIRVGTDLIEVSRFENFDFDGRLAKNVFTRRELRDCKSKNYPSQSLAGRFAAKEAVKKTIKENIKFNEIEIINCRDGSPRVNFLNKKTKKKYLSIISIAHTNQLGQAVCLTFVIK